MPDNREGDHIFSKRSVKSNKKRGLDGKLMNSYTGPWEVTKKAAGSSYELKHRDTGKPGKWHATHLSPFICELLPFLPIDGADNHYGQLHMPIQSDPNKDAGVKGSKPFQPLKFTHISIAHSAADDTYGAR